ncbi:MAG: hypothetical protein KBA28_03795 [Syntrophaceae bacterium]|nr:hypothetical protein [Syntrophaceae bacterium]
MKKIDDNILQQMLSEGKTQTEMAKHFGVSCAAICKKIKRLQKSAPPESFEQLTDKQKRFVLARAQGKTNTQAALESFDVTSRESAKAIGQRLQHDPDVNTALADLLAQEGIGRRRRVQRLKDVIEAADLGVCVRGLDLAAKLTGETAPVQNVTNLNILIAQIEQLQREQQADN